MKRKLAIAFLSAVCIAARWFLGVDRSWFVEYCPDCHFGRHIMQFRIFTIPVSERIFGGDSVLQHIASDIGINCGHPALERWHKHRWWGLVICACPCINGMSGVGSSAEASWYDDKASSTVKEMVKTEPTLRGEFAERVLKNHDWEYLKTFCERVRTSRDKKPAVFQ